MAPDPGERAPTLSSAGGRDKPARSGRLRLALAVASGPVALGLAWVLGHSPSFAESVFGRWVGPVLGWLLARATGWIPFSLAEWVLLLAAVHWIGRWVTASRLDGRRLRALGRATLLNLRDWSVIVALFTLLFGVQYRRPPLAERMDWPREIPPGQLERSTEASLLEVNGLYLELHGTSDAGRPTRLAGSFSSVDRALERAWPGVAAEFGLGPAASWTRGRTKGLLISPVLARLGLSGFYFPWTGEANRNRDVPAMRAPHVAAHEKAHQRGIAREDEASFLGWAVARRSSSPLARYSAAMYAHRRYLAALSYRDPDRARALLEARLPGVQRDVDDLRAYWNRYEGPATELATSVNDRYLRSQSIEDGVHSYGRSLRLLLAYAASREPSPAP